jgi:hypothetical protein
MSAIFNGTTSATPNTNARLLIITITGTITATQNSATVTGSGTTFLDQLNVGDRITIASVEYIIKSIESNTSLTLTAAYAGTTASGLSITSVPEVNYQSGGTSFIAIIKADNTNTADMRFGRSMNPAGDGTDLSDTARTWQLGPGEVSPAFSARNLKNYFSRSAVASQKFCVMINRT